MNEDNSHTFGIYLHIPFCSRRCDYCSFATWTDRHHLIDQYLAACKEQIKKKKADMFDLAISVVGPLKKELAEVKNELAEVQNELAKEKDKNKTGRRQTAVSPLSDATNA